MTKPEPIDYLDKLMPGKDLQELCYQAALFKANSKREKFIVIESRPYMKKCNLMNDAAVSECWQIHMRLESCDIYLTVVRRKYIPPLLETF